MVNKKYIKKKDECEVTFEYKGDAESVALVASANNWEPIRLKKRRKDGVFYTSVRYPKNTEVQFRYLVDGTKWENEPEADAQVPNEHGTQNSVIDTTPTG